MDHRSGHRKGNSEAPFCLEAGFLSNINLQEPNPNLLQELRDSILQVQELQEAQSRFRDTSSRASVAFQSQQSELAIDMKFKDLERVMNDRFSEVLKSLQSKNKTVEKKNILKQSPQDGDHSDDVVDVVGPTSTDSPVKETDKSVEMKEDKVNQEPSPFKNGEQHEKDDRIDKLSDIVVEEMQSLNSIISVREHDMTLTIYKPPPTTPDKNCGVFVVVYVEYLSEELGILFSDIDAQYHRLRYASLLCKYGSEKT
ncbi:hypothetical protein FXO37_14239 [Capsicum annuum]|nr:hypothetical protein FXO37_14239 [Capsicum annuum]